MGNKYIFQATWITIFHCSYNFFLFCLKEGPPQVKLKYYCSLTPLLPPPSLHPFFLSDPHPSNNFLITGLLSFATAHLHVVTVSFMFHPPFRNLPQ